MPKYFVISNRSEGQICETEDLNHAGLIVHGLMSCRTPSEAEGDWLDYWVRADDPVNGAEFYWDEGFRTVFSAACFEGAK